MPWRETPEELERAWAEQPVVVPCPDGNLFGILTPPAPAATPADICVIFLARPRFEQRRVTVELARRLAVCGFSCFRFDQHGWGDSEGDFTPMDPDEPRRKEMRAVFQYLKKQGHRRFVVWGLCLDARTALWSFVEQREFMAGLMFMSAPVSRLATPKMFTWKNLAKWSLSTERWRELLLSRSSRREAFKALRFIFRGTVQGRHDSLSSDFKEHFAALVKSRARALFFFGAEDGEYQSFKLAEDQLFPKLSEEARRRLEVEIWPGGVHSVVAMERQREIVERCFSWIAQLHPAHMENAKLLAANA